MPNSEKQVLAKCNLTPEVDLHKARIRGTYSTPGRGGDGDGKPPVWEATGTDGCVFEGIFYEKNTATTVFENPAEKNTKIENKKYAPAANKTFEDMRKKVVVPFGDGTAYGYYTSLSQGEYKGTHIDNEQTKVEYGKPCPSCDQKWLCVYRVAPKIAVKKTDWEFEDNSATFITLAFWVENKESATNPEATIGWKIHYAEVKTHEDKHKADYQAYLTSVKAAVEKYNSKVLIAKACGKSKAMAFKRAREIMGGELTELLKEFNNALVTAKNNDDKAA